MAWEWAAPAGVAAIVGIGNMVLTWRTGIRVRVHAEQLARAQQKHLMRVADRERAQQRKAEAYVQVLEVTEQLGLWAQNVNPVVDTGQELPPLPELPKQLSSQARLLAFASPEVEAFWMDWRKAFNAVRQAHIEMAYRSRDQNSPYIKFLEVMNELEDILRPKEKEQRKLLAEKIRAELAG